MKLDTEKDLSRLDSIAKGGYGYIINNAGKIIALITLIIAALVTFTDVSFSAFTEESFTVSLFVMLSASYIMYFSLEGSGERLGESTDEFEASLERYNTVRMKITPDLIGSLRNFCLEYTKKESEYRRKSVLAESGLTEEDYIIYKSGRPFPKKDIKSFKRSEKIKPARLTPTLLLSREKLSYRSELVSPEKTKIMSTLLGLLPTTLGTFFTVSVMLTTKGELNASVIIEGIIKLSALPIIGFKGYSKGYSFAKNVKSRWIETKAEILEEFLLKNR